jgi:hypothetical protein
MATDSSTGVIEEFEQINKTVGTIFQYILQAATVFGIVVLAALLIFVANDAIQPLTADLGWHLTFFVTLVIPTVVTGVYIYQQSTDAVAFGIFVVGILVVSLMFSGGAAMVFIDIVNPSTWAGLFITGVIPIGIIVGIQRYSRQISFWMRFGAATILFIYHYLGFLVRLSKHCCRRLVSISHSYSRARLISSRRFSPFCPVGCLSPSS